MPTSRPYGSWFLLYCSYFNCLTCLTGEPSIIPGFVVRHPPCMSIYVMKCFTDMHKRQSITYVTRWLCMCAQEIPEKKSRFNYIEAYLSLADIFCSNATIRPWVDAKAFNSSATSSVVECTVSITSIPALLAASWQSEPILFFHGLLQPGLQLQRIGCSPRCTGVPSMANLPYIPFPLAGPTGLVGVLCILLNKPGNMTVAARCR